MQTINTVKQLLRARKVAQDRGVEQVYFINHKLLKTKYVDNPIAERYFDARDSQSPRYRMNIEIMAKSIKANGLANIPLVRIDEKAENLHVVTGNTRTESLRYLKCSHVPCRVMDAMELSENKAHALARDENTVRFDVSDVSKIKKFAYVMSHRNGRKVKDIAKSLGTTLAYLYMASRVAKNPVLMYLCGKGKLRFGRLYAFLHRSAYTRVSKNLKLQHIFDEMVRDLFSKYSKYRIRFCARYKGALLSQFTEFCIDLLRCKGKPSLAKVLSMSLNKSKVSCPLLREHILYCSTVSSLRRWRRDVLQIIDERIKLLGRTV
jgi:hypothetical protein